ncbi:transcriptional regulatory protein [Roseobacter sp. MED193]|uniref:MarR family winged helix-turn-helix transcriptional regulator n=1 Tax=Roseobacter sp. MED193 TaxID=314262 RepID=UPI000068A21F|nr:MarR family transcriptional regulator [Roseobacter sp. MED193]EAQ45333.1 transcriptional regulatory protein [Roseobacter sp. MED193]
MKVQNMAGHLIRRLNQASTHIFAKRMQETGVDLTPVQFAAMDAIASYPGIDQAGVAARIAYDRATIGGVIDRLEQKGYVRRSVSTRDRRAREVHLTDQGLALFQDVLPLVEHMQGEMLEMLTGEERSAFLSLARKALGKVATDDAS